MLRTLRLAPLALTVIPYAPAAPQTSAPGETPRAAAGDSGPDSNENAPPVRWQRKLFKADACPPEMPRPAREVVRDWADWAQSMGYRMDLDADARVVLLSSASRRSVRRQTDLVNETLERFDALLPPTAPTLVLADGADVALARTAAEGEEPIVLLWCAERADYLAALEHLTEREPYLADWAPSAEAAPGFVLEVPRCGAWLDDSGDPEWSPNNELVNRLVHALVGARYGRVPHWLAEGLAWHVEQEVTRSLHCFPGRDGFVSADEHDGWSATLKDVYERRTHAALDVTELTRWGRGTFDDGHAAVAWGLVGFLAKHRSEALAPLAADLAAMHEVHGIVTRDDGSWELLPGYEVPPGEQKSLLLRHAGEDVLTECMRYFQRGKRYRAPRGS